MHQTMQSIEDLFELQSICDGHLGRVKASQQRIELSSAGLRPLTSACIKLELIARVRKEWTRKKDRGLSHRTASELVSITNFLRTQEVQYDPILSGPQKTQFNYSAGCVSYSKNGQMDRIARMRHCFSTFDPNSGYRNVNTARRQRLVCNCDASCTFIVHSYAICTEERTRHISVCNGRHDLYCTVHWLVLLVYRDKIVILSKSPETHIKYLRPVSTLHFNVSVTFILRKVRDLLWHH